MDKTNIGLHVSPISIPIPILLWIHLYYSSSIVDPFPQHYVVFMVQADHLSSILYSGIMCNQWAISWRFSLWLFINFWTSSSWGYKINLWSPFFLSFCGLWCVLKRPGKSIRYRLAGSLVLFFSIFQKVGMVARFFPLPF